jgi:hypothetical protein
LLGRLRWKALVSADRQTVPHVDRGNGHQELHNFPLLEIRNARRLIDGGETATTVARDLECPEQLLIAERGH